MAADPQSPGVIRGVVLSEAGEPAAEATVSLSSAPVPVPDMAALTGETGEFALAAPARAVVSFHMDQPWLDLSGRGVPYIPAAGAAVELPEAVFLHNPYL